MSRSQDATLKASCWSGVRPSRGWSPLHSDGYTSASTETPGGGDQPSNGQKCRRRSGWARSHRNHGKPARVIAMPMIATPEYLRAVLDAVEDVVIYTARLDRGLSSPEALARLPGERWSEERGLNEHGYIVPGAGGMGEVLNNSWC